MTSTSPFGGHTLSLFGIQGKGSAQAAIATVTAVKVPPSSIKTTDAQGGGRAIGSAYARASRGIRGAELGSRSGRR